MAHRQRRSFGFDGRTFLLATEWQTYRRRKPVRYIRKPLQHVCEVCGLPATTDNPFQNAHRIGFDLGIIELGLTPDFLDGHSNIRTAHRKRCNQSAELDLESAMRLLKRFGVNSRLKKRTI